MNKVIDQLKNLQKNKMVSMLLNLVILTTVLLQSSFLSKIMDNIIIKIVVVAIVGFISVHNIELGLILGVSLAIILSTPHLTENFADCDSDECNTHCEDKIQKPSLPSSMQEKTTEAPRAPVTPPAPPPAPAPATAQSVPAEQATPATPAVPAEQQTPTSTPATPATPPVPAEQPTSPVPAEQPTPQEQRKQEIVSGIKNIQSTQPMDKQQVRNFILLLNIPDVNSDSIASIPDEKLLKVYNLIQKYEMKEMKENFTVKKNDSDIISGFQSFLKKVESIFKPTTPVQYSKSKPVSDLDKFFRTLTENIQNVLKSKPTSGSGQHFSPEPLKNQINDILHTNTVDLDEIDKTCMDNTSCKCANIN